MRVIDSETNMGQTEELSFYGATVVFNSVKILNTKVNEACSLLNNSRELDKIESYDFGYYERLFVERQNQHSIYKVKRQDILPPIQITNEFIITPVINFYITIYEQRVILVQSVMIFDKRNLSKMKCCKTDIQQALDVTDLLMLIHNIKNKKNDCYHEFIRSTKQVFELVADTLKAKYSRWTEEIRMNEQNIAIQVWDIASLPDDCDRKNISGDYLEERYELDLAALLLLYDEHHTENGIWKELSKRQIFNVVENKNDVLKDHRILSSERICIEISQIDEPKIAPISKGRLQYYGYDSTSVFLWGYLAIMEMGYKNCFYEMKSLCSEVQDISNEGLTERSFRDIMNERQRILTDWDLYSSIDEMCIEERHKTFIKEGIKKKGLERYVENINTIDKRIQEQSDITLSEYTSKTSEEISCLLDKFQQYNEQQDKSNGKISEISLVLAISSIFGVAEYIANVASIDSIVGNVISFFIIALIFIIVAIVIVKKRK